MFGIPKTEFKKEIWYFLFSIFLVHVAAYLVVPIFPLILKNEKDLGPAEIGLIIGTNAFSMQLGSLIAGIISDRIGNKYCILISNSLQAIGLLGLGFSNRFVFLALFSGLNGMGTGIYIPSTKAAISHIALEDRLTTAFSLRNIASHMGISIAGLAILISATNLNFIFGGGIYITLFIFAWFFLPRDCGEHPCPTFEISSYFEILKNKNFLFFSFFSILIWALHTQLPFLLPLRGDAILKNSSLIGIIWTLTSIVVIVFQSSVSRLFLEKRSHVNSIFLGILLIGTGITLIGFANSFPLLILSALVFIAGEMFAIPTLDSVTGIFADPKFVGAYFAVASFSSGIGGAIGSFTSGGIIEKYTITNSSTPWIIYGSFTLILAFLFKLFIRKENIKKANHRD